LPKEWKQMKKEAAEDLTNGGMESDDDYPLDYKNDEDPFSDSVAEKRKVTVIWNQNHKRNTEEEALDNSTRIQEKYSQ
jgi:hypothetical protein